MMITVELKRSVCAIYTVAKMVNSLVLSSILYKSSDVAVFYSSGMVRRCVNAAK